MSASRLPLRTSRCADRKNDPMSPEDEGLVAMATEAIRNYGDGVKHTVAVALRTHDGQTFTGVNVYAMGGGAHAELTALATAISSGHPDVEVLVAVGDRDRGVIEACGLCRQMLVDYAPEAEMIVPWNGQIKRVAVREMLPNAFESWFV